MRWLHISDIHFNYSGYDSQNLKNKLLKKLDDLSLCFDFILLTGDCFYQYSATQAQEKQLCTFVKDIAKKCKCSRRKVYICQGNHDANRNDSKRNELIDKIREANKDFSQSYDELCEFGNEKFQNVYKSITGNDYISYKVFEPKNQLYRIVSLNSCLLSKDKQDTGKLRICNEKLLELSNKIFNDARVNILILHHGFDCLAQDDAKKLAHWADDNNIDVVFCGHTHRAAIEVLDDTYREIKQITSGGIVIDGYAIPSFYICEYDGVKAELSLQLYTYTSKQEDWVIDNTSLRKFKGGKHTYVLPRIESNMPKLELQSNIYHEFNLRYAEKYKTYRIYSNKFEGEENFNSWKIVDSLVNIGIDYTKALMITETVINEITSDHFVTSHSMLSCFELRNVVYESLVKYKPQRDESDFEVSCWASKYARKYNRNKEILILKDNNQSEKLNYSYIKNQLISQVFDSITHNPCYYKKVTGKELCSMAESLLTFLKGMTVFEIQEKVLLDLVKEYMTQKPHPWLVNGNRQELLNYHKEQAEKHIRDLLNSPVIITQMEAAYHVCSAFMVMYDEYIGCEEISPIIALTNAVNWIYDDEKFQNDKLPMLRHRVVQMKKDLEAHSISFSDFVITLNVLMDNIIKRRDVSNKATADAIIKLWDILRKIDEPVKQKTHENALDRARCLFSSATGFISRAPLRALPSCFWVEPNWEKYESNPKCLGEQFLVCVLESEADVELIHSYFYVQNEGTRCSEMVFLHKDFSPFSPESREKIRRLFKNNYVRCIFVQEGNIQSVSETFGWRTIFYDVLSKSKIS